MSLKPGHSFEALGLPSFLVSAVARLEYEEPTPIQKEAIPHLLAGKDVLGLAATGTGKTAAFALPMLANMKPQTGRALSPLGLVLVPTRELALQVTEALHQYGQADGYKVVPVFGGQDIGQQLQKLKRGVDIVVATPGRALDHLRRKSLQLKDIQCVVLDEADEMLDMGFAEDLETLLSEIPTARQTALFSATMPPRITKMVDKYLKHPVKVSIAKAKALPGEAPKVRQVVYVVPRPFKVTALMRILQLENAPSSLVFCRTRSEVDELTATLTDLGLRAEALHGGLQQNQRDRVMRSFKSAHAAVLVATDVAARGLHIDNLAQVINFDVPNSSETYVHRIGRTGRAGKEGMAITLAEPREARFIETLERAAGTKMEVLPVPGPKELQAKRNLKIQSELEDEMALGKASSFQGWLEALPKDKVALVALASLELLKKMRFPPTEMDVVEIPTFSGKEKKKRSDRKDGGGRELGSRPSHGKPSPSKNFEGKGKERRGAPSGSVPSRLYIGGGRAMGIRPGDLVGAIANETGLPSKHIGPIEIHERFSLVSVPAQSAEKVITALRHSSLRGRKVQVRRDNGKES